jgi:hypothetical protein
MRSSRAEARRLPQLHHRGFAGARFAANYERQADGRLKMIVDPAQSGYRQASSLSGGGLVLTVDG